MVGSATPLRRVVASRWFKLALSLGLLLLLLRKADVHAMRDALAAAAPGWVALALAALVGSQVMSAYRWALLAWAVGFTDPFARICTYYFSGMYLNLFGPGTVAGDVGRVFFLAGGERRALALTTVVAHRAIGFVALVWITAVAIVVLPDQPLPSPARWLAALAVPGICGGWLWGPRLVARLLPRTNNWRVLVERDLAPYWYDYRLLAISLGWATATQLVQLGAQALVARSLGLNLPASFFFVVVPIIGAIGTLPLSLQGIGVREAGYWYYLARIGVSREAALAVGLLTSMVVIGTGLTGFPAFLLLRQPSAARGDHPSRRIA